MPNPSHPDKNTADAARVRDNKRRQRARQREYVADLERKVTEAREQGVQATKEVQLAAQRVVRENTKLRDLLRRMGYTDSAIDAWVAEDGCMQGGERHQLMLKLISGKNTEEGSSKCEPQTAKVAEAQSACVGEKEPDQTRTSRKGGCMNKGTPCSAEPQSEKPDVVATKVCTGACPETPSLPEDPDSPLAPCKLLTLLSKNPAADITQVPLLAQSDKQPCKASELEDRSIDGVECNTAYKMLMQYATTEEKMDKIAVALEKGCVPSATGGCKVKKSEVWAFLDEECT